jgi:Replication-relaxation
VPVRAGASQRDFERVFASDEECVLAAFEEGLARLSEVVGEAVSLQGTWLSRLRAGLVALLGFFDDEPGWARVLLEPPPTGGMAVLRCEQRVMGVLSGLLEDGAPLTAGEPVCDPTLTAELAAGGVLAHIRTRMRTGGEKDFVELAPILMSFMVRPYLGQTVAQAELVGAPRDQGTVPAVALPVRATHRTTVVLRAIAGAPRSSNRQISEIAGLVDEGQASRLLNRLQGRGVIENLRRGQVRGEPNAWVLTAYGEQVLRRLDTTPDGRPRAYRARRVRGSA